ncbi:MAG TPA: type II toxin-antitoxin system VapC family toxin [Vicinamibacterales bacterium]|jgi:PIN domain nuclease of toxin-antitoxin system|nr:type II toxin-antitoxin system VapC family toxin [Vicinamibacterales bacterium]
MRTLLDTHAWVWWVTEDPRLSGRAKATIEKSQREDALWLSLISIWELAKKVEKDQLVLDRPLDQWLDLAMTAQGLHLAELTRPILVESCQLPQPLPGDPADQIIVATARHHEAVLVTKDRKLRDYSHVRSVW